MADLPTLIRITDDTTRAEIEEAFVHLRASQRRAPAYMTERYHERYNALLLAWEQAPTTSNA